MLCPVTCETGLVKTLITGNGTLLEKISIQLDNWKNFEPLFSNLPRLRCLTLLYDSIKCSKESIGSPKYIGCCKNLVKIQIWDIASRDAGVTCISPYDDETFR